MTMNGTPYSTTDEAANDILGIIEDEALGLGGIMAVERTEKRARSNEIVVSVKHDGQTFRITMQWVRDECLAQMEARPGWAYIETDWSLRLEPELHGGSFALPYRWRIEPCVESVPMSAHPRFVDENWLRTLIRSKLASPQLT